MISKVLLQPFCTALNSRPRRPDFDAFGLKELLKMKNGDYFNDALILDLVDDFGNGDTINFSDFKRLWKHIEVRLCEFEQYGQQRLCQGKGSTGRNENTTYRPLMEPCSQTP